MKTNNKLGINKKNKKSSKSHTNKALALKTKTEPNKNKKKEAVSREIVTPAEQRNYFVEQFESTNATKLSSLELHSIQDTYFIKLSESIKQEPDNLGKHIKQVFALSWKQVLCEQKLVEGTVDPGCPAVLVISASAIRALEMMRGLRILTKECQAVKLFAKHLKVDEQVAQLKNRVNIASGTPSRIKKLFEIEALGLSRLEVIVLDMHTDIKGYSLLTLPQVRDEFWDLYKTYFHQRLLQGSLRVCLYGPIRIDSGRRKKDSPDQ